MVPTGRLVHTYVWSKLPSLRKLNRGLVMRPCLYDKQNEYNYSMTLKTSAICNHGAALPIGEFPALLA